MQLPRVCTETRRRRGIKGGGAIWAKAGCGGGGKGDFPLVDSWGEVLLNVATKNFRFENKKLCYSFNIS